MLDFSGARCCVSDLFVSFAKDFLRFMVFCSQVALTHVTASGQSFWCTVEPQPYGSCTPPVAECFCLGGGWPTWAVRMTSTFNLPTKTWTARRQCHRACLRTLSPVAALLYRCNLAQRLWTSMPFVSFRWESVDWFHVCVCVGLRVATLLTYHVLVCQLM